MKVTIVFGHPYMAKACDNVPHDRSFSAALLKSVTEGLEGRHEVSIIDLHKDNFDPVLREADLKMWRQCKINDPLAQKYYEILKSSEHIIFIFPIWWECMPAMTKGFLDKVFVKGLVFKEVKPKRPFVCLLPNLKGVSLLTTMATPHFIYRYIFGDPIRKILFRGTFRKMGISNLKWHNYAGVEHQSLEYRQQKLQETKEIFARF